MFNLILHTALLVLAAFILGAILGCLLKRLLTSGSTYGAQTRSTPAQTAAAAATATVAASVATTATKADDGALAKKAADDAAAKKAAADKAAKAKATKAAKAAKEKADAEAAAAKAAEQAVEMDDAAAAAAIAALPADASNEDKANAVGSRPSGIAVPMGGKKDNLQRIKGIGKVNEGKLNDLGIFHFSQVGEWSPSEARWVGTFLAFSGRIEREDWIGQAKVLAAGGETDFAKRVDKGEVSTSSSKKR